MPFLGLPATGSDEQGVYYRRKPDEGQRPPKCLKVLGVRARVGADSFHSTRGAVRGTNRAVWNETERIPGTCAASQVRGNLPGSSPNHHAPSLTFPYSRGGFVNVVGRRAAGGA